MTPEERLKAIRELVCRTEETWQISKEIWDAAAIAIGEMDEEFKAIKQNRAAVGLENAPEAPLQRRTRFNKGTVYSDLKHAEEGLNATQIREITKLVEELIVEHVDTAALTTALFRELGK